MPLRGSGNAPCGTGGGRGRVAHATAGGSPAVQKRWTRCKKQERVFWPALLSVARKFASGGSFEGLNVA